MSHKARLLDFIERTLLLDNLVDARISDIDFIRKGGRIYLTPDHSTWSAFFFPITDGKEHKASNESKIDGFAEVYPEIDKADTPYVDGSTLTNKETTGVLGKILIDSIFSPSDVAHSPAFFLTDESRRGLDDTIKHVLRERKYRSRSISEHKLVYTALTQLKSDLSATTPEEGFAAVATNVGRDSPAWLKLMLNDGNATNLNERARAFNKLTRVDIKTLVNSVETKDGARLNFDLSAKDIDELKDHTKHFTAIMSHALDKSADSKIRSLAEILALNLVVGQKTKVPTRFLYLTNSPWAVNDFDRFSWDARVDEPLKLFDEQGDLKSVAKLFVRNPLCFLQDIESRAFEVGPEQPLKIFVDSIIPRNFRNARRLGLNDRKKRHIVAALTKPENERHLDFYNSELTSFYESWGRKKRPWVNLFLAKRAEEWQPEFEVFERAGLQAFWSQANGEFARSAWKMGIYLATVSEIGSARAAPLVFIDCDSTTNNLLTAMQKDLSQRNMEDLGAEIEKFNTRYNGLYSTGRPKAREREQYFDALVNSVLFMMSNQFNTAETYAATACEISLRSDDGSITGREAFYLRSHLVRITARSNGDFERARRYMLLARSKLSEDNRNMPASPVSDIRFDLEDWSRRIVKAMPPISKPGGAIGPNLLIEYLSFVKEAVDSRLGLLSDEEKGLLPRICGKMLFNFIVLIVSIEEFGLKADATPKGARRQMVLLWNEIFASKFEDLRIRVSRQLLKDASAIEASYYVSLAAITSDCDFVDVDITVLDKVKEIFPPKATHMSNGAGEVPESPAVKAAKTSVVDDLRFKKLRKLCYESLGLPAEGVL